MAAGSIKTVYEKPSKKRTYNGRKTPQTKPSRVVCPYCHIVVAHHEKVAITDKGIAHYNCAIDSVFNRIKTIGLPLPSVFSLGRDFQEYLANQAKILLWQDPENAEYKLTEILDISEEVFGKQPQLSKLLMTRQSQGLNP